MLSEVFQPPKSFFPLAIFCHFFLSCETHNRGGGSIFIHFPPSIVQLIFGLQFSFFLSVCTASLLEVLGGSYPHLSNLNGEKHKKNHFCSTFDAICTFWGKRSSPSPPSWISHWSEPVTEGVTDDNFTSLKLTEYSSEFSRLVSIRHISIDIARN